MNLGERINIVEGDITALDVDVVVNAANASLAPGGGVCGAIHNAAGPDLAKACAEIGHCPTGEARLTPGFAMRANFVAHAVGPIWAGGDANEDALLAQCYKHSLQLAQSSDAGSIAFPAISTGIYGFPADRAASIAVASVVGFALEHQDPKTIILCCFASESADLHRSALVSQLDRMA